MNVDTCSVPSFCPYLVQCTLANVFGFITTKRCAILLRILLYLPLRVWESCSFLKIATEMCAETAGTFLAQEAANSEYRTVTAVFVMLAAVCVTFLWQQHSKCWECWSHCCEKYWLFECTLGYDMTHSQGLSVI